MKWFGIILSLALLGGIGFLAFVLISGFASFVLSLDSDVAKQVVAVSGAIIIATITVVVGQILKSRAEIEAALRERKIEIYEKFLKQLFRIFYGAEQIDHAIESGSELVKFFQDFHTDLILRGDKRVLQAYVIWKAKLALSNAQSIYAMENLVKAIRADIGLSNSDLAKGIFTHFWLRNAGLFLGLAKSNPNITLEELAEAERRLTNDD